MYGARRCTHVIDNRVDFVCSSSGTGKGLDIGRGLSQNVCPIEDDEEHLNLDTRDFTVSAAALFFLFLMVEVMTSASTHSQ